MAPTQPTDTSHERERNKTNNPSPSPDVVTYSPNFNSVREELKHDPCRYSPLDENGWKLVLDLNREFLYTFGEYPEDSTYDSLSSILRGHCEDRRRAAGGDPDDPMVKEHARNTQETCPCMLCSEHARLALDVEHYLYFRKTLTS